VVQELQHEPQADITRPGVAITSSASGVKPIVASTDRSPAIAASDAQAPRWQLTIRRSGPGGGVDVVEFVGGEGSAGAGVAAGFGDAVGGLARGSMWPSAMAWL
jgi:hypothetical protein